MTTATQTREAPSAPRVALEDLFPLDDPPAPLKVSTLRWYARHRDTNGFARCMIRIGKRDFVVRSRFEERIAAQLDRQPPALPVKRRGGAR